MPLRHARPAREASARQPHVRDARPARTGPLGHEQGGGTDGGDAFVRWMLQHPDHADLGAYLRSKGWTADTPDGLLRLLASKRAGAGLRARLQQAAAVWHAGE